MLRGLKLLKILCIFRFVGREHSPYPKDGGGQEKELCDEIQDGVVDLTGRWNDESCYSEEDRCHERGNGDGGLKFG